MKKYKNNFYDLEKNLINSNIYNDINHCKYIHLEDALQIVYNKVTGKNFNFEEYKHNKEKEKEKDNKSNEEIVKNFINEIFLHSYKNINN